MLSNHRKWQWDLAQQQAFEKIKMELCKPTILAFYNPSLPTKITADASSYGLGLQQSNLAWRPVCYASRSMSETEMRYAQIEKEALAAVWACEKFADYIIGLKIVIETDHKPPVPLLGTKSLDDLPPRVLRFRLRLARFDYTILHVPEKLLFTADAHLCHSLIMIQERMRKQNISWKCVSVTCQQVKNSSQNIQKHKQQTPFARQ